MWMTSEIECAEIDDADAEVDQMTPNERRQISRRIQSIIDYYADGNAARLSRDSGVKYNHLRHALYADKQTLSLANAILICATYRQARLSLDYIYRGVKDGLEYDFIKFLDERGL